MGNYLFTWTIKFVQATTILIHLGNKIDSLLILKLWPYYSHLDNILFKKTTNYQS